MISGTIECIGGLFTTEVELLTLKTQELLRLNLRFYEVLVHVHVILYVDLQDDQVNFVGILRLFSLTFWSGFLMTETFKFSYAVRFSSFHIQKHYTL